jgi:hypothetical protein
MIPSLLMSQSSTVGVAAVKGMFERQRMAKSIIVNSILFSFDFFIISGYSFSISGSEQA